MFTTPSMGEDNPHDLLLSARQYLISDQILLVGLHVLPCQLRASTPRLAVSWFAVRSAKCTSGGQTVGVVQA
jgi:hypothetical protein